jgi:hypothetical protein
MVLVAKKYQNLNRAALKSIDWFKQSHAFASRLAPGFSIMNASTIKRPLYYFDQK